MGGTFDIVEAILNLPLLRFIGLVDFCDKLSFIATCVLLIACSVAITLREYVMSPISCYMSQSPGGENLLNFIENYCWVQGTMSIKDHIVPDNDKDWTEFEKSRIVYYQWVPLMLLLQATMFHVPRILWSLFTFNITGVNVHRIVELAACPDLTFKVDIVTSRIEYMLLEHREYRTDRVNRFKRRMYQHLPLCVISKRLGTWLTVGYLFTKLLYLVNCIGQIYLMQAFLHLRNVKGFSSNFGMEIVRNIMIGRTWEHTNVFPRVTYCMARVKHMASVNTVTAQCVLTANLFIEKIYIFLWFWVVMLSVVSACSLLAWVLRCSIHSRYSADVKKYLEMRNSTSEDDDDESVEGFCREFLRLDGHFLLRMIRINAGDLVAAPIVRQLYTIYLDKYKGRNFTTWDSSREPVNDRDLTMVKGQSTDSP